MSLQSYGKPNLKKVENWHKLDRFRNRIVFSEAAHTDVDNLNHDYISTLHKFCEQLVLDFIVLILLQMFLFVIVCLIL